MLGNHETRYCETGHGFVGYQVFGDGPRDIVFVTNWLTNVEVIWEEPAARRYLERLASMGRVVFVDKRGTGVSDPHGTGRVDPVEDYVDDVMSVLIEVGIEEAAIIGDTEGGALALMLAATYPERFPILILVNSFARLRRDDDYPIGAPGEVLEKLASDWASLYGHSADPLNYMAPSMSNDQRFRTSWLRQIRLSMPPGVARHAVSWIGDTDVRSVLPAIQARVLVVTRSDAQMHRPQFGRFLAANIAGAVYRELKGTDTNPFYAGEFGPVLDEIEEFLTGEPANVDPNRMLATVLFTDIVGSTAIATDIGDDRWLDLRASHDEIARATVERHRGVPVKTTGDGLVATFDGPQRGVVCAISLRGELASIGLSIRAGLHAGEIEVREGDIGGVAVNIASRVMGVAESGGVLVSRTVKDLVVGSHLLFNDCGQFQLKGVPGDWNLYEAVARDDRVLSPQSHPPDRVV